MKIFSVKQIMVFFLLLISFISLVGCSAQSTEEIPSDVPVFEDELKTKLADPRLLARLGVEALILLEVESYRVTIGSTNSSEPIGELYYTIQDGWHLKAENEVMKFVPGEGWLIAEQ